MTFDIIIESNKIINHFLKGDIDKYVFDIIDNTIKFNIIKYIIDQIDKLEIQKNNNYKKQYLCPLYNFLIDNINNIYSSKNITDELKKNIDQFLIDSLLAKLTVIFKGQKLLNKLQHRINILALTDNDIYNFLLQSAKYGTFLTFFFWLNKTKKDITKLSIDIQNEIEISSIANSDDRLYKYIIDKHLSDKQNIIYSMITSLACSNIPTKYQLKRIKYLSQKIDLTTYFKYMLNSFNCEKIIYELHKYYYIKPHDYFSILTLILKLVQIETNLTINLDNNKVMKLLNIFKTEEEKIIYKIQISLIDYNYDFEVINKNIINKVIIDNYKLIIKQISWSDFLPSLAYNHFNKFIFNTIVENNLITKLLADDYLNLYSLKLKVLFFTRFLPVNDNFYKYNNSTSKKVISINFFLHKLRLLAKRKKNAKMIQYKVKMFEVINEIKTFKPNKLIPVLSKGSYQYQLQKQKFNNILPCQKLPNELYNYKHFLIREKIKGTFVNDIPIGIYPHNEYITKMQIKAEYLEEYDLYLVYDINIPNTTILERYNILRKSHSYTMNKQIITSINTLDELKLYIDDDNNNMMKFINENKRETIKWYPKFLCEYRTMNDKIIYKQLIDYISTNCFNFNSIIITPLDGEDEIKIKPKTLLSINLKYYNKKWLDKNNNDRTSIIDCKNIIPKNNCIYKCYPKIDTYPLIFKVNEYRYDKKIPDDSHTINNIINIIG